jgi:putative phage-type endonuclease
LHRGARNGTLEQIPKELLTLELFLIQNHEGQTALHVAAHKCTLRQVPEAFVTSQTLSVKDQFNRTPLHIAAYYGSLDQLPNPECITLENLSVKDGFGRTPVHIAAQHGHLNQLPLHLLTPEVLAMETDNPHRQSVLHVAARNGSWNQIQSSLLTPSLLAQQNAYGETPLQTLEFNRPTEKQMRYLRNLGIEVDESTLTKSKASELIDFGLPDSRRSLPAKPTPTTHDIPHPELGAFSVIELIQGSPEWLEWRRNGIGASDAPTIMGENPWKSADQLLEEKCVKLRESQTTPAMENGIALEPEARRAYISQTGRLVQAACLQSTDHAWLRASVDGITLTLDWVMEIKCGEAVYNKTSEYGRVPDYYYGQLQHILTVTGLGMIDFWCYLPGARPLLLSVERDQKYIERLLATEAHFWTEVLTHRR